MKRKKGAATQRDYLRRPDCSRRDRMSANGREQTFVSLLKERPLSVISSAATIVRDGRIVLKNSDVGLSGRFSQKSLKIGLRNINDLGEPPASKIR